MQDRLIVFCLLMVAIINTLPVVGLFSVERLEEAYAITLASHDMELLMRHRALLFGILGGFVFVSIFLKPFRAAAMVMAALSMVGFVVLASLIGEQGEALKKVLLIDLVGIVALAIAAVMSWRNRR